MEPDWKYKNDSADTSLKEDLSIDTAFYPARFSWDTLLKCLVWFVTVTWDPCFALSKKYLATKKI